PYKETKPEVKSASHRSVPANLRKRSAGMSTNSKKPICPRCASSIVFFREKDRTLGCHRCGHRWDETEAVASELAELLGQAMKTGNAEGHGMRIENFRFIPAKAK